MPLVAPDIDRILGDLPRMDIDAIFPPGQGKTLILQNCTGCHTFVRIVSGQKSVGRWGIVKSSHSTRVSHLSHEDFDGLFAYLEKNFNDTKPEPNLPEWFRQLW